MRERFLTKFKNKDEDFLVDLSLIILGSCLLIVIASSLQWRLQHDSPIMLYIAYSIAKFGLVPYLDIFDMNIAGTYFAYSLIGKLSTYSDLGARLIDLVIFSAISLFGWLWMRPFGNRVAWCSTILWGLVYFGAGPKMSLQREFLILLPIVAGVYISSQLNKPNPFIKYIIVGILFGIAFTIKPHSIIGLPLLLIYEFLINSDQQSNWQTFLLKITLLTIIGFVIPIFIMVIYLWSVEAINPFWDIIQNYWPLYTQLTGEHFTISGIRRIIYLFQNYRELGKSSLWVVAAAFGVYCSLYLSSLSNTNKRRVLLLVGLAICYSFYPVITGQFWDYHWLLFFFFIIQLSSLCLIQHQTHIEKNQKIFPLIILLLTVIFTITPPRTLIEQVVTGEFPTPNNGRVDEIATFLKANLSPGDTVQPLDWTGGTVNAMLLTGARIATPFIYDFHFYHHISSDYTQELRRNFLVDLEETRPRFIIEVFSDDKPWVSGIDTTREFKELRNLLTYEYIIVFEGDGYTIFEIQKYGYQP